MRSLLALFVLLLSFSQLFATEEMFYTDYEEPTEKVLYLSYDNPVKRVIKGEYFSLTIKLLSTIGNYNNLYYTFSDANGVTVLSETPSRVKKGKYYYDTFFFTATEQMAVTPKITASLASYEAVLDSLPLTVITLNPKKNYAHILADTFSITNYKTTIYDQENNIIVFSANATRSDLSKFELTGIDKQGFETKNFEIESASMTYYAVIPKKDDNLIFTYFNLQKQKFKKIIIPIIVDEDRVSTQSNLKPKENKHQRIKLIGAATVLIIGLALLLYKRNVLFLIMVIVPGYYVYITALPTEYECIKAASPIQLLPMKNGTVFETTTSQLTLKAQGKVNAFTKVQLENKKIGWVKDENICTP